jgi:biopolymer transport protein ExbD
MVAAPMMQQGFAVQLPQARQTRAITAPVTVTIPISFRRDRMVRLDKEAVRLDVLHERIRQALDGQLQQDVILAGDGGITLQEMMSVFDQLKAGGVKNVAMQAQPPTNR